MSGSEAAPAVLYVDDEPINLRVFDANFRSRFRVLTASSGAEALEILTARGQEIAVLISDQRMPGMTGVELLETARRITPDVRRMLITAYSDMQAVMDAVNRGQVIRYFVKPWVKEELAAALEDAVGIFQLQGRLRAIEARMLQSERLAVLGQVSAGIAHELMNPVSYITQNVATLKREIDLLRRWVHPRLEADPNPEIRQTLEDLPALLEDVETGAKHIRHVALNIRSQARGEDVEATSVVRDVVDFAVKIARAEVRHRARISMHGGNESVRVGPVKLCQVVINLIVNSAHAMPDQKVGNVDIRWRREDGFVLLEVADNGVGIPPEVQSRVFEPMFTTKPVGTGTGLGLAITRDIVRQAGGEVTLRSTVGEGTTVQLKLPAA